MDKDATLTKTAKGVDEIKTRAHGLPQKQRALLIMVDGNTTAGALLSRLGGGAETERSLQILVDQGFVELKAPPRAPISLSGEPSTSKRTGVQIAGEPSTPSRSGTREQALALLTKAARDLLGADAELVVGGIERARNRREFNAAVERCAELITPRAGSIKADLFRTRAILYAEQYLGDF